MRCSSWVAGWPRRKVSRNSYGNAMSQRKSSKRRPARREKGRLILVLGGASSGKSEAALRLAGSREPRAFIATGQGLDDEMAARIARHQTARSKDWETVEEPLEV